MMKAVFPKWFLIFRSLSVFQTSIQTEFTCRKFSRIKEWISLVIKKEGFVPGNISIIFTNDDYLLDINRKYLGKDYYTDVIGFNYSSGDTISGDIVISIDRVRENSVTYSTVLKDEIDRVIIHGVLHLVGYDDSNDHERLIMRDKEDHYLQQRTYV